LKNFRNVVALRHYSGDVYPWLTFQALLSQFAGIDSMWYQLLGTEGSEIVLHLALRVFVFDNYVGLN